MKPERCQGRTFAQEVTKADEMSSWNGDQLSAKGGEWKIKVKIHRAFLTPTNNQMSGYCRNTPLAHTEIFCPRENVGEEMNLALLLQEKRTLFIHF